MQDRYVADIGDFGKFQLFRFLFNDTNDTLALIWFLHHHEESNNDGQYIDYFARIKGSDIELERMMQTILKSSNRKVQTLEELNVLKHADYFYPTIPTNYHDRVIWFQKVLSFATPHPIVAVAPDNGMMLHCHKSSQSFSFATQHEKKVKAHKYIYEEEIDALFHAPNRKITILYQHLGRCFSHDKQIEALLILHKKKYPAIIAMKHKPYSPRLFFFLCHDKNILKELSHKIKSFEKKYDSSWKVYL